MSDVERLSVPAAHSVFSQHTGSYSGTSVSAAAPPFAPRPHYGQQVRQQQHQQRLHSAAPSTRSGATSTTHTDRIPPSAVSGTSSASTTECSIHEVCHYFQQAVFILAILTGIALVAAGAVLHAQNGELLVLVYIGVLLGAVNSVLLTIQCCVRRKQKRRARAHRAARQTASASTAVHNPPPSSAVVRYDPLSNPLLSAAAQSAPPSEIQQYHYKHYVIHAPPPQQQQQPPFQDFPHSPTDQPPRNPLYHRSGSIGGQRHKGGMQRSPPLGQVHRPLLQQGGMRSDLCQQESYKPTYEDLLRSGRIPQDGTTIHLI